MKRLLGLLFLLLVSPTFCLAEQAAVQKRSGSWTAPDMKLYQAGKRTQVSGNVLSVEEGNAQDADQTLKFKLSTKKGDFLVDVGPRWYLLNNSFHITKGQPVTVAGVSIRFQGKNAIEAQELRSGKQRITLRDETGKPTWQSKER